MLYWSVFNSNLPYSIITLALSYLLDHILYMFNVKSLFLMCPEFHIVNYFILIKAIVGVNFLCIIKAVLLESPSGACLAGNVSSP